MATNLISYPFRLATNGFVVVREDDTEAYYTEELACLALTIPGERPLVPEYGIEDPVFGDFVQEELVAKVDLFGPPVIITDVTTEYPGEGRMTISVSFNEEETSFTYYTEDDEDGDVSDA